MGWRFRKSFKLFPGVRLNLSSRGLSTTIGYGPASLNVGSQGAHVNLNIPGTGISYRHKLTGGQPDQYSPIQYQPDSASGFALPVTPAPDNQRQEIRSASTYELTSEGLKALHKLIVEVDAEQRSLDAEIAVAERDWQNKSAKYLRWENGFLLKHVWKDRFANLGREASLSRDKLDELNQQRQLTRLATQIDIANELKPAFGRIFDTFSVLAASTRIWDATSTKRINRYRERSIANDSIERSLVRFRLDQSDFFQCDWKVPHMENANGGDLFIYPGFLLYKVTSEAFAVIDCREVSIEYAAIGFVEEEQVPSDSQVVGQAWKYANKNGSRDLRFSNNYQIPLVRYGQLTLRSPTGLNEVYQISNAQSAEAFAVAWNNFKSALRN